MGDMDIALSAHYHPSIGNLICSHTELSGGYNKDTERNPDAEVAGNIKDQILDEASQGNDLFQRICAPKLSLVLYYGHLYPLPSPPAVNRATDPGPGATLMVGSAHLVGPWACEHLSKFSAQTTEKYQYLSDPARSNTEVAPMAGTFSRWTTENRAVGTVAVYTTLA
jgi:hypothetical protein